MPSPNLRHIASQDGRFAPEALAFLAESFQRAHALAGGPRRHVSAAELAAGVVDLAAERWGLLADLVLQSWGVTGPGDLGAMTWLLIEHGVFSRQDDDRPEDFQDLGDLRELLHTRVVHRLGIAP